MRSGEDRTKSIAVISARGRDVTTFIKMLKDESGASAAEYALILAIIGSAIAVAAIGLSGAIANEMDESAACIDDTSQCEAA